MGRDHRLRRRSRAGGTVLSGDPALLADAAGRRADAELFRNPAEDRAARSGQAGLPDPGATRSRSRRADQFVRNRIAGPDIIAGDRGPCRRACGGVRPETQLTVTPAITAKPLRRDDGGGVLGIWLVEGFESGMSQPLDLVL